MKKMSIAIFVLALSLAGIFAFGKENKNDRKASDYSILQKWDLPEVLNEISGIAWIGEHKVAAVQDEDGIIFIYDLNTSTIEKEIRFHGSGDYEGIRISNGDALVLRSDGTIFKVADYLGSAPQVTQHQTTLSKVKDIDVEGLGLDKKNARLLLAEKIRKGNKKSKGIYAVTLNLKDSWDKPAFKINLEDQVLEKADKDPEKRFYPSEITVHPTNDKYYLLDGRNPKLLIMEPGGRLEKLFLLDQADFEQPEGLTFDSSGNLYISNEAGDRPANILKVSLN